MNIAAQDGEEIFPSERRQRILGVLQEEGKVVAAEMAGRLNVSIDTIRRDLNQLAQEGLIQRVHGLCARDNAAIAALGSYPTSETRYVK